MNARDIGGGSKSIAAFCSLADKLQLIGKPRGVPEEVRKRKGTKGGSRGFMKAGKENTSYSKKINMV